MIAILISPFYLALNAVFFVEIIHWLSACSGFFKKLPVRIVLGVIYLFFTVSMLIAFFLPSGQLQRTMKLISNFWLGFEMYLLVVGGIGNLIYLIHHLVKKEKSRRFFVTLGAVCAVVIIGTCVYGVFNARNIRVTPYEITVDKDGGELDELNVVLISDLHMGYNTGVSQITQMVEKVNAQNPDLIVIAGDFFDNEYEALDDPDKLSEILQGLEATYGVYAVYGNHDIEEPILAGFTFGGSANKESSPEMDKFVEASGVTLLRDEGVLIADSVYLFGRADYERPGRGITVRKTAEEIVAETDASNTIIVLDHEPREQQELADAGVDVDLCGHTHDGQLFPGSVLTYILWENSYGYLQKGSMHNIVSSGVGVFGPNMRVGTIAEICTIKITFQ